MKKLLQQKITYKNIQIKHYEIVTYLGCILDEAVSKESIDRCILDEKMSGKPMALKVSNIINARFKCLHLSA